MKKIVAVIPAKSSSLRVPQKNFRSFYKERSLLEIKIKQCMDANCFSAVYVSSDSDAAKEIAEKHGATFVARDPVLCLDTTPWSDVLVGVLKQIPVDDDTYIAWLPLTSPLFSRFNDAVDLLEKSHDIDSVMSVTKLQHYFLGSDLIPLNFQYGVWASYTQKIKPLFQMNCALWLAKKKSMIQNRFQIGDRPGFLETSLFESIDIDTMDEFEIAQLLYKRHIEG